MADKSVVLSKLESVKHCLTRISEKLPEKAGDLKEDYDLQDIISVNLERTIQAIVDTGLHIVPVDFQERPGDMASVFDVLADNIVISPELAAGLRNAVGFRNIAVHEYQKLDWDIVFSIASKNIFDFKGFIRSVLLYIGENIV